MQPNVQRTWLTGVAVAAVLGAGAAATVVNASILDSDSTTESPATELLAPPATRTAPTTAGPAVPNIKIIRIDADDMPSPSSVPPSTIGSNPDVATTVAPASSVTEFSIGDAGVVAVTSDGTTVLDVQTTAGAGWVVAGQDFGPDWARVVLRSSDTEITFDLELTNGEFVTNVSARAIGAPSTTVDARRYDDDDDDEYDDEYEERDDDREEHEDHEEEDDD